MWGVGVVGLAAAAGAADGDGDGVWGCSASRRVGVVERWRVARAVGAVMARRGDGRSSRTERRSDLLIFGVM